MRSFYYFFSLILVGCQSQSDQILEIAVASNMQYAMKELAKTFSETTGIPCRYTLSSSGKLTTQIKQGAPWDIFIAADSWYPMQLHKEGYTIDSPRVYAFGKLVIWSNISEAGLGMDDLVDSQIRNIAVANPQTAPYGKSAIESLKRAGILPKVESKLIYGENISQTNQFILSASVQAGFTSQAVVMAPNMKGLGYWTWVADSLYTPIAQSMVLLNTGSKPKMSRKFQDFILSTEGQKILWKYGYSSGTEAVRKPLD